MSTHIEQLIDFISDLLLLVKLVSCRFVSPVYDS